MTDFPRPGLTPYGQEVKSAKVHKENAANWKEIEENDEWPVDLMSFEMWRNITAYERKADETGGTKFQQLMSVMLVDHAGGVKKNHPKVTNYYTARKGLGDPFAGPLPDELTDEQELKQRVHFGKNTGEIDKKVHVGSSTATAQQTGPAGATHKRDGQSNGVDMFDVPRLGRVWEELCLEHWIGLEAQWRP